MNEKPICPLCLRLENAKAEIFAAVNAANKKHNIPFFLLESIVAEASRQVAGLAHTERENEKRNYEQEITEYNKQRGERDEQ